MAEYHIILNKKDLNEDRLKKAMIVQPMNGLTDEQIKSKREEAIKQLELMGYEFVNSYIDDDPTDESFINIPVYYLAKSIEQMSKCDSVYFCRGWEAFRSCCIEHEVAVKFGLEIIEENRKDS